MHYRSKLLLKRLVLITLCALPLVSQAQKRQKSHNISFQIDGYPNEKITLAYHQQGKHYIEDSLFTDDRGRAVWNHIEDIPRGVYLAVFPELGNIYFEFIVSGNESFDIRTSADNVVDNLAFQGSAENDVFYQDMDQMAALSKQANALNAQIQEADAEQKKALRDQIEVLSQTIKASRAALMREHSTLFYATLLGVMQETEIPDWLSEADNRVKFQYYHDHFLDYIDFSDPGIIRTPVFHNKMMNYLAKATEQVPDSLMKAAVNLVELSRANDDVFQYVLVQVLNKYANSEIVCMDKIYVELVMRYYKTGLAYWTDSAQNAKIVERGMALAPIVCGQIAPEMCLYDHNFTFPANRLNEVCLDNIESDYTILFIYDPDCGHCKKATPKLVDFHEKFIDYGISVYAVSTTVHDSAQVEEWHEFIESKGLEKFYNVADLFNNRGMRDNYDLSATPVVFVLDADKRIIGKRLGVEQIEQFIRSYWSSNDRERFDRAEDDFGPLKDLIEELRRQREAGEDDEQISNVVETREEAESEARNQEKILQEQLVEVKEELAESLPISSNIITGVRASIKENIQDARNPELNLHVEYFYEVVKAKLETKTNDYPGGAYRLDQSNSALLTSTFIKRTLENELKKYLTPGRNVSVIITGSTDGTPITSRLKYRGEYGNLDNYYFNDGDLRTIYLNQNDLITENEELAYLRTLGLRNYLERNISALNSVNLDIEHRTVVHDERGAEHRRISVEIIVHDVMNQNVEESLTKLFYKTKDAVFYVFAGDGSDRGIGSGFFISSDGIGVSNYHVLNKKNYRGAEILLENGEIFEIKRIIEENEETDFVIFEVDNNGQEFPKLDISYLSNVIGEEVYAIGNPFKLEKTLSNGIISGLRENNNLIQTTTPITHGSSGGPLFNNKGQVIGITTFGFREAAANLNFAVNIKLLRLERFK